MLIHIIPGLGIGGAETNLFRLLASPASDPKTTMVVTLAYEGHYAELLRARGYRVLCLGINKSPKAMIGFVRLLGLIAGQRGSLRLVSWMYHASLIVSLARLLSFKRARHVWMVRHSLADWSQEKPLTRVVIRLCAWASKTPGLRPALIVYNAKRCRQEHEARGYPGRLGDVVPNGFNVEAYQPVPPEQKAARRADLGLLELGLKPQAPVIVYAGRYSLVKNLPLFLQALARVFDQSSQAQALIIGRDTGPDNPALAPLIAALPQERLLFLGERTDLAQLLPAGDLFCLSSNSEGFPNVLVEAGLSGLLLVATDAGDADQILASPAQLCPVGDADRLAAALLASLALDPQEAARRTCDQRQHLVERYALSGQQAKLQALFG